MPNNLNYEKMYKDLKEWLYWEKGIEIPFSIEPYTEEERKRRDNIPKIYWNKRDEEDYE